jgi:DNA-directed RNA polymerase subunit RPC12/RpoP
MQPDSEKPPDKGTTRIKCPKCGHKFSCDPGWIKVSDFISCPNCGELIRVKESETD